MASRKDDDGLPPRGAPTSPPPPARARPQIRPIAAPSGGSLPPRARAPISLPSGSNRGAPPALSKPIPRFPAPPIEDSTDDDPTRTEIPADLFQEPPPPANRRMPQPTLRGQAPPPTRALGNPRPAPAPRAPAPAPAPATRPSPRVSAPTPIPPRMGAPTPAAPRTTSPGPVFTRPQPRAEVVKAEAKPPPSRLETTGTELFPGPRPAIKPAVRVGAPAPRGEPRPTPVVAKPQRPSIDIVPKDQRNVDPPERTVVMPAAPGRPGVRPRAGFPAPREPETTRPPAPSVPSLDALIEPITPARQPSNRPAAARSPFVHQRPLDDAQPRTRTDRPAAARPASVAPPQLHPPSFPPPANEPAGYDHQDSTVAMARPWTPPAPAVQPAQMQMAPQPGHLPGLPGVPMTPQAIPIMPHPGFGTAPPQGFVPPPHLTAPLAPPRPFGIVLFAAPLLLATGLVAALALLF